MFRLEDVQKSYAHRGAAVVALSPTTLEMNPGEYVTIVGPSGSGKTTLLSLLGGMLSPTQGRVWLANTSLYEITATERTHLRREKIGFVFQTFNLVPYLTALENVQVPLYLAGMTGSEQQRRATELLQHVGLGDRLGHKPSQLSTGQQQRVALARTLANNPPVVLADEPTGNLDPDSRSRVLDFLDELHGEGRTIIMVTHDPAAAERAQRRLVLSGGAIVSDSGGSASRAA